MKNLFKYAFALVVSALVMSACTDEYEYVPADAYKGLYITGEQTSYDFTTEDPVQSFVIKVVRANSSAAQTVVLTSDNELFNVPESVTFEEGQTEVEFTVTCNLAPGQEETLNISLPKGMYDATYFSGTFATTVICDYIWEDAGEAEYVSPFWGHEATVAVRHATDTNIYELVSVFAEGYNIRFTLNDDYNAESMPMLQSSGIVDGTYGPVTMEFDPKYSVFTNEGNVFKFSVFWRVAAGYFNTKAAFDSFTWTEGYPGE